MKYENEVTVEVDCELEKLIEILIKENFKLQEKYKVNDIYMVKNEVNIYKTTPLDILKNSILIRNIITKEEDIKQLVYKYKEYNDKEEIVKQGKAICKIESIDEAYTFLKTIGYKRLINIDDNLKIYSNKEDEFALEIVGNHTYIEIEENCYYIDKKYNGVKDMIESFNKYNIPIKNNDYFVKKAKIAIKEEYNI